MIGRHMLLAMPDPPARRPDWSRWEYEITWRYGPVILLLVGLAMLGAGISGICGTSISLTIIPVGFVCLVAGVALPRIQGRFTAGPQGISGEMRPWDERFYISGPAVAPKKDVVVEGPTAKVLIEAVPGSVVATQAPTLGDVWDALRQAGIRPEQSTMGYAHLRMPDGRVMSLPSPRMLDWRPASEDLLGILRSWDVHPVASGKYPAPSDLPSTKATGPVSPRITG
jgi:hypothetical protein